MNGLLHTPLYSIPECARYLGLPISTVRGWIAMPGLGCEGDERRLVKPAGSNPTALSFTNLVEVFVLSSLRRNRAKPTKELLKSALSRRGYDDCRRPRDLAKVEVCLKRIEYDGAGVPVRFYPFTRGFGRESPKLVAIDPAVKFGRPVIAGTGVPTGVIAKFVKAGESMLELAEDYRVEPAQIEEAVRYELAE